MSMTINFRPLILKQLLIAFFLCLGTTAMAEYESGVAKTGVNFRSGPGMRYRVITGVPRGEVFEVLGTAGRWTKVRLESGRSGYIYSKYVGRGAQYLPETEGGYCEHCDANAKTERVAQGNAVDVLNVVRPQAGFANCVTQKIMSAAKWVHRNKYGGRRKGKGKCQYAIRFALERAGVWPGGGYGNAKDTIPTMLKMGFKNIFKPGMKPKDAPPGAILVYDKKRKGARCKTSKGNTYGHIELKENNNSWYYDGNPEFNIQQAYGEACRPLKGIMVMGNSCPTCSKKLKQSCGG